MAPKRIPKTLFTAVTGAPLGRHFVRYWRDLASYAALAIACATIVLLCFNLAHADLHVPFGWTHLTDASLYAEFFKATVENGTFRTNCSLAAPGCQYHYDIPVIEIFHSYAVAFLALLCGNLFLAANLYVFAGPVFAAFVALFVLRSFGISRLTAMACSVLYAFLPAYFFRGVWHLALALYGLCPFAILFFRWTLHASEDGGLAWREGEQFKYNRTRLAIGVLVSVLLGVTSAYYSVFFCCLLAAAVIVATLRRLSWRPVMTAGILIGTIVITVGLNLLPGRLFSSKYGANPEAYSRHFSAAEVYGLKIIQMLLPVSGHRIAALRALKDRYNTGAPLVNENFIATLGMVGSVGFLLLLGYGLSGRFRNMAGHKGLLDDLGILNLIAVLLATIGGFGALIAFLVTDNIRCYNRISPIIAFACLAAIAAVLELWRLSCRGRRLLMGAFWAALTAITVWGLFDQFSIFVGPPAKETYEESAKSFAADRDFIGKIDSLVPVGGMVFQAPRHTYWEAGPVFRMDDYDHLGAYLLSKHVHWSYGAIRGRWEDAWQRRVEELPRPIELQTLCAVGFQGIYVDRSGFADGGVAYEKPLRDLVGPPALVSSSGRRAFYSLAKCKERLGGDRTAEDWSSLSTRMMNAVFLHPARGVGPVERSAVHTWHWCAKDIDIAIHNGMLKAQHIEVELDLYTGYERPSTGRIEYPGGREYIRISSAGYHYRRSLTAPPGRSTLAIRTDAKQYGAPGDPRELFVRLEDLHVHETGWGGPQIQWGQGYFMLERDPYSSWHWSGEKAVLLLTNTSREADETTLRAILRTGHPAAANLRISGLINEHLEVNSSDTIWTRKVVVPPGSHRLVFECAAKPVFAPGDSRIRVLQTKDFQIGTTYADESFLLID